MKRWIFGVTVVAILLPGCTKKSEAPQEETPQEKQTQSAAVKAPDVSVTPAKAEETAPPETPKDVKVVRMYFEHLAAGRIEEAKSMTLMKTSDCEAVFRKVEFCPEILRGQVEAYESLDKDPVPHNAKILEISPGQEQKMDVNNGFREGVSLWVGTTLRARGPGGHEFTLRSLGVMDNGNITRVLWGKRRAFGDTPRNPKSIPPAKQ